MQARNDEAVDLLSSDFVRRSEASFAAGNVISNYLMIPGLRAFWPLSSINESGQALDLSGQGRTLSNQGSAPFLVQSLVPYAVFNGSDQYLYRASEAGLVITDSVTFGAWFFFERVGAVNIMGKFGAVGNRAYMLQLQEASYPRLYLSSDGTASVGVASTEVATTYEWYFIAGRYKPLAGGGVYDPLGGMTIFVNQVTAPYSLIKTTVTNGTPAALYASTAQFQWGSLASSYMKGHSALGWVSSVPLSDAYIYHLYEQSKALFGY